MGSGYFLLAIGATSGRAIYAMHVKLEESINDRRLPCTWLIGGVLLSHIFNASI